MLIICNGMPRSGSTANYNLLREYLGVVSSPILVGFFSEEKLRKDAERLCAMARSKEIYLIKTHEALPPILDAEFQYGNIFHCYSIRDVREIATSMKRVWGFSTDKVLLTLKHHTEIASSMALTDSVRVLRYEKMNTDVEFLLKEVSFFISVPFDGSAMVHAKNAVESLKSETRTVAQLKAIMLWSRLIEKTNHSLKLGKILKFFIPDDIVTRWRDKLIFVDPKTMLHPGHIGKSEDINQSREIEKIVEQEFMTWLKSFEYVR